MFRKLGLTLLCAASACFTISTSAYSTTSHMLQQGMTVEYALAPHDPHLFINYMFWTVEAHCTIQTEDESNEILAEAVSRTGKVNDVDLKQGDSLRICVHPGENLTLKADSGAKVKLTNFGEHTVTATCTAA